MKRKLYIDKSNRLFLGVCAGIAQYLNIDPTVVRIISIILILMTGLIPGIAAYIIIALITPDKNANKF